MFIYLSYKATRNNCVFTLCDIIYLEYLLEMERKKENPKRCTICGRWFLKTDARCTKYCGEICIDDPKGRKCRVIGNMNGRDEREKAADHPLIVRVPDKLLPVML